MDPLKELHNFSLFLNYFIIFSLLVVFVILVTLFLSLEKNIANKKITLFGSTDIGKRRKRNEDYYIIKTIDKESIAGVFDGVGGEERGDLASKLAGEAFEKSFETYLHTSNPKEIIKRGYIDANNAIKKAKKEFELTKIATTATIFLTFQNKGYYSNIGDSRLYLLREDKLIQLTRDDTVVEILISEGKITKEEAKFHPMRNMITKALDGDLAEVPEVKEIEVLSGDIFLLCTDGLYNMVEDKKIKKILLEKIEGREKVKKLIKEANLNGGKDNITVIIQEFS